MGLITKYKVNHFWFISIILINKDQRLMKAIVKIAISSLFIIFLFSCTKDFVEINTDPHGFTTASSGSLFNGIVESLELTWNETLLNRSVPVK